MAAQLPKQLFWLEYVKRIIWDPFWWLIVMLFVFWVPFLRVWWWVIAPLLLSAQLKTLYLWWIRWDFAYPKLKWVVLEMIPPKEVLVPIKAMEDVFNVVWPLWDGANWRERWCEGELNYAPFWCSWEIVSTEGKIHFYLRVLAQHRASVETALFGHFPALEIHQVTDYVKNVPPNVPNAEWDLYGEDFILPKPEYYPIRTFDKFFEPQGERISAEEKRIDPINSLLESMSKLGPGENYWVQFITMPVQTSDEPDWPSEGHRAIAKISKRAEKKEKTFFQELTEVFGWLILGPTKEGSGEKAQYSWTSAEQTETGEREMVITPGEREIITEIDNKLKRAVFKTVVRAVYITKRDCWRSPHRVMMRSYLAHFATQNLNRLQFTGDTRPKVHYIWRKRRAFLRARKMFRNTVARLTPAFPNRQKYTAMLNTEEMATLFHFPIKISGASAPTLSSVDSKKSGPPPNLPVE